CRRITTGGAFPPVVSSSPATRLFFFQAEDGIRDATVTGVQTCALPICPGSAVSAPPSLAGRISPCAPAAPTLRFRPLCRRARPRSEERRVGKGGRSRGRRCHGGAAERRTRAAFAQELSEP